MSDSLLDKALGLVSSIQNKRTEGRNDLMRTILPEVLQPEELKEAAVKGPWRMAPYQEARDKGEAIAGGVALGSIPIGLALLSKGRGWKERAALGVGGIAAGATGYGLLNLLNKQMRESEQSMVDDMNTAWQNKLEEQAKLQASNWEKEAASAPMKEEGPKTLHAPKYDRRMKFNTALERSKHEASKEEPAWLKEAGDAVFDFDGVTGRESTITTEEELERTPPLPIEEPEWYDVPNKPVMQKGAGTLENETFTQRHPGFLPILLGLGGAAAGAVPGALLGGRHAVKSVQKQYANSVARAAKAKADASSAFTNASKSRSTPDDIWDKLRKNVGKSDDAYKKILENKPNEATHRTIGRVGGGMLGGLAGGSTGMLGGLALNDPAVYEF